MRHGSHPTSYWYTSYWYIVPSRAVIGLVNIGAQSAGLFDSVLRIGGIPTTRLWRNLESSLHHWPVLSFSTLPFSGLARVRERALPLSALVRLKDGWAGPRLTMASPEELNTAYSLKQSPNVPKNLDIFCYHVPNAMYQQEGGTMYQQEGGSSQALPKGLSISWTEEPRRIKRHSWPPFLS